MLLVLFLLGVTSYTTSYRLPGSCEPGQFYEPSLMDCLTCPANVSLVTATDGFGCACEEHSIPVGVNRCRRCNITQVVASDGTSCVPRRCQSAAGRISCRKCPRDYISVTRNFDGSPMKEVQCVKCARGYKAVDNRCERCEACSCGKNEIVVKGKCVPRKYLLDRPKYTENRLHPDELLEIVKLEFLCTRQDIRACRALASSCVRNFYTPEFAGPCRLWTQPKFANFKGLPLLTIDSTKHKTEFSLERGRDILMIAMAKHTSDGGFQIFTESKESVKLCLSPMKIKIGEDMSLNCVHNVSELTSSEFTDIYEFYLLSEKCLDPLPIFIRKPNGYYVKNDAWSSKGNFRKLFLINKYLSTTTNTTSTIYLRSLLIQVIIHRDKSKAGYLRLRLNIDAQYATPDSDEVTTTLVVEHNMPDAGVTYMLQIFGGVLGALVFVLGLVQWRGAVRRGGAYVSIVPLVASSVADALHFATLLSTLHALAAEAGTLGLTLPLSQEEEHVIEILVYTCVSLKCLKVLWFNWNQCRCDIFFVDWSRYNPSIEEITISDKSNQWKTDMLAREWSSLQTKRRVLPGYTITITLLVLHFLLPWPSPVPRSRGYKWVTALVTWWCAYIVLFLTRILADKLLEPQPNRLIKVCADLEMSMMVFQEEYYAHYVNGRNADAMDFRSMTHPLSSCRIVCSPQLRTVYKKLSVSGLTGLKDSQSNRELLNQFLAAFFERALDGLNWVASERTIMEKFLDVELVTREGGSTSVLLYDADFTTPSCFAMTWRGEEWTLATFDAMLFGCVLIASDQTLLAALITLMVWKIMNIARMLFGNWNVQRKINLIN